MKSAIHRAGPTLGLAYVMRRYSSLRISYSHVLMFTLFYYAAVAATSATLLSVGLSRLALTDEAGLAAGRDMP